MVPTKFWLAAGGNGDLLTPLTPIAVYEWTYPLRLNVGEARARNPADTAGQDPEPKSFTDPRGSEWQWVRVLANEDGTGESVWVCRHVSMV
ncbi:hypothetical protein AYO41_00060 [Verrucomicrobia bacterium SCGC AG-212-E04]|nr:hypothetical protein AYO41_00060 [Verrucomicrobia bacterium SCGC AG-212-E04]